MTQSSSPLLSESQQELESRQALKSRREPGGSLMEQSFQGQLQQLAANFPGMIYQLLRSPTGELSFPYVSSGCEELCEVAPAEAMANAKSLLGLIAPADVETFEQTMAESAQQLMPWFWEGSVLLDSGQEKWIRGEATLTQQIDGSLLWNGLWIDVSQRKKAEQELRRLNHELVAKVDAQAKALAQAHQELRHLASLDRLTQIANRRRFDQCLFQEWKRMSREHQCLSLILIDIDHFESYNDRYGHLAGDQCLHRVAQMLRLTVMRPADLVSRYDGAKFAIILPNTPIAGAEAVAKRIQAGMAALGINHDRSPTALWATLSLGIATTVPNTETLPTTLIEYSDTALYEAKTQGRNRYDRQLF